MTNIVLLCRDRLRLTEQALGSLRANTPYDSYNLTIVDDGSADFRVRRLLDGEAANRNTTLIRIEHGTHVLAQAKNLGVYWSEQMFGRGDWLYISDNDVFFSDGWMEKLTHAAEPTELEGFGLWGGQIHPFHKPTHHLQIWPLAEYQILDGPSWLMRWQTWDAHGPFNRDGAPGPCQSEEYPFCERLKAAGGRIGVINPHVVFHTGLTQTDGKDAPGRKEREALMVPGVIYE